MDIWKEEKYRKLQGTVPVISLSFANVKETTFPLARKALCYTIKDLYNRYGFLLEGDLLNADEKKMFQKVSVDMENYLAANSIRALSDYLGRYYGKKPIILLDEYDTPMQEAYVYGYWTEIVEFMRNLFNTTFKTNPYFGYLKIERYAIDENTDREEYDLKLTNKKVRLMFQNMIEGWFKTYIPAYNDFVKALLEGDIEAMNDYMNDIALETFSSFDTGVRASNRSQPERFYHGLVLGLMVDLSGRYTGIKGDCC